ncbi:hypothetical protein E2C01_010780 [Portunus trituberculatus]|uniref:Uncharacterized protein n=1 Tax=Portunus trituberculatus TaxID=210409 RepID=A0A5B7D9C1_PORTR|nr:hypothetical protein [Portunus trituberculatus]
MEQPVRDSDQSHTQPSPKHFAHLLTDRAGQQMTFLQGGELVHMRMTDHNKDKEESILWLHQQLVGWHETPQYLT